jgi:hypothetical protein
MRLGVRIDGEARPPWARQQSFPARAVQPLFRPESPSQAKDDYANRDSSPGSRPSPAGARIHSSRRRDLGIRGEWNRFVAIPVMWCEPGAPRQTLVPLRLSTT